MEPALHAEELLAGRRGRTLEEVLRTFFNRCVLTICWGGCIPALQLMQRRGRGYDISSGVLLQEARRRLDHRTSLTPLRRAVEASRTGTAHTPHLLLLAGRGVKLPPVHARRDGG